MARPGRIQFHAPALLYNLTQVKRHAPGKSIIAMLKANAYGCGIQLVQQILESHVDCFGVACLEEALQLRAMGSRTPCVLLEGVFSADELDPVVKHNFQCVIHNTQQLQWHLNVPQSTATSIWIKVNTGMNRLGFLPQAIPQIVDSLSRCPWIKKPIGLMMHFACADIPDDVRNKQQWQQFQTLSQLTDCKRSTANSAAILAFPQYHADSVRPGLMLYGVSPFPQTSGTSLGLLPVMQLTSRIIAIHHLSAGDNVGYGRMWQAQRPSIIGVIAMGYADGYPRHLHSSPNVGIKGMTAPVVGNVSMDMLTVDLTDCPGAGLDDEVELWGKHIAIETVAAAAGTIPYELMCHVSARCR